MPEQSYQFGTVLYNAPRVVKALVLSAIDYGLLAFSLFLSLYLRLGQLEGYFFEVAFVPFFIFAAVGVLANWGLGFYHSLARSFDTRMLRILVSGVLVTAFFIATYSYFTQLQLHRLIPMIFVFVATPILACNRFLIYRLYQLAASPSHYTHQVLIYGTGNHASQIASLVAATAGMEPVGFIDDRPGMGGQFLQGKKIYRSDELGKLKKRYRNLKILLSSDDIDIDRRRNLARSLSSQGLVVQIMPKMQDIIAGKNLLDQIRSVDIQDLLGRETVPPLDRFFGQPIKGRCVLVTGAAGSIGSEICFHIISNKPKRLVLVDISEFSIYQLTKTIEKLTLEERPEITLELGNICDTAFVRRLLKQTNPDIVYHAAAYKHVNIVEGNVLAAIQNNIIGTDILAGECFKAGVRRFILISTDKAVRPTNVMGATKRIAEMIIQARAKETGDTIFTMVRFGNVLGSSGSIIPLIQSQIAEGGPVTITDKNATRFFMTITEAAQLVVQAGFLAEGGEVYILDMGEPVRITELAELLIRLSGYSIRSEDRPDGDIEIEYIGLRPGEKMHEELLLSNASNTTLHPKIRMSNEPSISCAEMRKMVDAFKKAISKGSISDGLTLLEHYADGYQK